MSGWYDWVLATGRQHGVDPIVFATIYIGAIPFFFASLGWLVRRGKAGRSTVLPVISAGLFFCSAYLYLAIAGRGIPAWVWIFLAVLILYGAWSTIRSVRGKMRTSRQ
ncbi:hypothetical protein [Sphingomonas sp. TREG-RG-20F-R18-01]|uniref:hypothetical protein n=1 Tax=Sphingomonas sp. TREG-RG-20F-R18-01 TaxID=2914982 RepID=UPI001F593BC2|nr:hypothetical protein [Sphingomonas sp. TREG-RG-20F-R18-01]